MSLLGEKIENNSNPYDSHVGDSTENVSSGDSEPLIGKHRGKKVKVTSFKGRFKKMVTIQPLQINLDFSQIYATLI